MFKVPNEYRDRTTPIYGSDDSIGSNGRFNIPISENFGFLVVASDGLGWEHVSVSVGEAGKMQTRCPTWDEMCQIKEMFWDEDDCVVQYHPAKSEYVNCHPYVLHLWRPTNQVIPIPWKEMVGPSAFTKK